MKDPVKPSYPARKQRDLSLDERKQLRSRIELGEQDSYRLAAEFGCSASQVAGVRAHVSRRTASQIALQTAPELALEVEWLRGTPALASLMEHFHSLMLSVVMRVPKLKAWVQKNRPRADDVLASSLAPVYLPVPGMYGGFKYRLSIVGGKPLLNVESWCRIEAGSSRAHEVSPQGSRVVWEEEPKLQVLPPDEERNSEGAEPTRGY